MQMLSFALYAEKKFRKQFNWRYKMLKQEFLRENDLTVTIKTVDYDEILSRKPKKETKAYKKAATLQIGFVDYTIEIMKRCALEKVKGFDETVDGTEAVFPMIFPDTRGFCWVIRTQQVYQ